MLIAFVTSILIHCKLHTHTHTHIKGKTRMLTVTSVLNLKNKEAYMTTVQLIIFNFFYTILLSWEIVCTLYFNFVFHYINTIFL